MLYVNQQTNNVAGNRDSNRKKNELVQFDYDLKLIPVNFVQLTDIAFLCLLSCNYVCRRCSHLYLDSSTAYRRV